MHYKREINYHDYENCNILSAQDFSDAGSGPTVLYVTCQFIH